MTLERLNLQAMEQVQSVLGFIQHRRAPLVAAAALAVLAVIVLVMTVFAVLRPAPVVSALPQITNQAQNGRWNWFPVARQQQPEPEPVEETEDLARASIRAELLGVLISAEGSYAAISTSSVPDGVYAIGDEIEDNVTLEAVEHNRAIISQRGSRRQIPLKSLEEGGGQNDQELFLRNETTSTSNGGGFNLSGLMSTTPVQVAGGIGLRLENLSEDLTDLAEVEEGDIVLAVNGSAISDMMSNPLLWQQFSQQTSMPVTILRGEDEIEVFVNAASLSQKILPQIGAGRVQ